MIAQLTGLVGQIEADRCVVEVGGVGYLVFASTRTLAALPPAPGIARVLIETQVREDAISLFGFADPAERDWFRLLTTVQGVGARVALGVLSTLGPADLAAAITAGDRASLVRAPGVGARLADRMLVELRGKVAGMPAMSASMPTDASGSPAGGLAADALLALGGLGFRRIEAHPVVMRIIGRLGAAAALDTVIRESLQALGPRGS